MTKFAIKAIFSPHTGEGDNKYTHYEEKLFDNLDEALEAIDIEYGDTLAQAATIDAENEDDLQGYYFSDLWPYAVNV